MSAGKTGEYPGEPPLTIYNSLDERFAPGMKRKVLAVIARMEAQGFDPIVHEAYRSAETQIIYYARGRTQIPPHETCTHAPTNLLSFHGFGLAADIISRSMGWDAPQAFWDALGEAAKAEGLAWGGDWPEPKTDLPHVEVDVGHATPSEHTRELLATGGLEAVWENVGLGA